MLTRSLDKARQAYKDKDIDATKKAHSPHAPEPHRQEEGQYIKSIVYGGLDGIITTFAVVAGVAGAALSSGIVLILGFANLFADGISMAIGDYLSTKAENEYNAAERAREAWEVDHFPDGEKQELVELYIDRGIDEADARTMVNIIAKHKKAWVDIMMVEELGIIESGESPLRNAFATFLSFALFGFVPLIAFVVTRLAPSLAHTAFPVALLMTAATLFTLGALKVRITQRHWLISGLEMLLVGGLAAAAAFGIGALLSGLA